MYTWLRFFFWILIQTKDQVLLLHVHVCLEMHAVTLSVTKSADLTKCSIRDLVIGFVRVIFLDNALATNLTWLLKCSLMGLRACMHSVFSTAHLTRTNKSVSTTKITSSSTIIFLLTLNMTSAQKSPKRRSETTTLARPDDHTWWTTATLVVQSFTLSLFSLSDTKSAPVSELKSFLFYHLFLRRMFTGTRWA